MELINFIDNLVGNLRENFYVRWYVTPTGRIYFEFSNVDLVGRYWINGSVCRRGVKSGDVRLTVGQVRYKLRKGLVK